MMKRSISISALLLASISAIIGSGWLFAVQYTAMLAGPSALLAWIIGGLAIIIVAYTFAELSSMLPIMGSSTRIPHYTHGTLVSFLFSWIIWLTYVAYSAAEVQAVIMYGSYYFPSLVNTQGSLTQTGYIAATLLMLLISSINIYSLRWLMRANSALTILKITIPVLIGGVILSLFFSPSHAIHPNQSQFMPFGIQGVFAAITSGGIIFAFNGFKQAAEMAGEAKNPKIALPIALIGSVVICLLIYLVLQIAFLTSLTPQNLAQGWQHIKLLSANSPLAAILAQDHLSFLLILLYVGAIICPLAAALMYVNSSARSLYGKSKNGTLPPVFAKLTLSGSPARAICINFAVAMLLYLPLQGFQSIMTFIGAAVALTYAIAPICLLTLRSQAPLQPRPFKVPLYRFWCWLAFYICTLMTLWGGWNNMQKMGIALFAGLSLLIVYAKCSKRQSKIKLNWRESTWLWLYFFGLMVISYLSSYGGGMNIIPFGWDFIVTGIFCAIILVFAQRFKLPANITLAHIEELKTSI